MENIQQYFSPINIDDYNLPDNHHCLGKVINKYINKDSIIDLSDIEIVIMGISESRGYAIHTQNYNGADDVREYLYQFSYIENQPKIFDMGNLIIGKSLKDTRLLLNEIFEFFSSYNILPIIIGGSQDITYNQYMGFALNKKVINTTIIDSKIDMKDDNGEMNSQSYLNYIILQQPSYLFNLSHMCSQSCFVNIDEIKLMRRLYFNHHRLGNVRNDMVENEAIFRGTDLLSVDISSIKQSDAMGQDHPSPNGLYSEEICQLMRYAGISNRMSSVGIYEYNPSLDIKGQTANLIAQMIWYFLDGYSNRLAEFPDEKSDKFVTYHVTLTELSDDLIFYQSKLSDRWWLKVINPEKVKKEYLHHYIIPCSYSDYQQAMKDELPLRWWNAFKKLQ